MEEKIMDAQVQEEAPNQEVQPAPKKSGLKNFLQLVVFILLSMAGFIVQMIIEQVGFRLPFIEKLNSEEFPLFGLTQQKGAFIVTMVAVFVCKLINFILHRKVLFKARANVAFSIASYIIISVILWIGSAAIKVPVQNALTSMDWWNNLFKNDPEGWALTAAIMVYSTADLIIMFFAEKFVIMNDKLFKKGRVKQEEKSEEDTQVVDESDQQVKTQIIEELAVDVVQQEVAKQKEEVVDETTTIEVASKEKALQSQEEISAQADIAAQTAQEATFSIQPKTVKSIEEVKEIKPIKKTSTATVKKSTTTSKTSSTKKTSTTKKASTAKKSTSTAKNATSSTVKKSTSTTAKKTQPKASAKEN